MSRLGLAVLCVLLGSHNLFADLALTVKDISLMLRAGYSSKAILADLETRHFAETLDSKGEVELIELRASPELIAALKSGKHAASLKEMIDRQVASTQQADEAERITRQAATNQPREKQQTQIVVVPAQTRSEFLTPSEIAAKQREAKLAEIAERARYCAEHPVECETLEAIRSARREAESAKNEARRAQSELQSLKTDLWMQGIQR
jgi:hypothetical protein